MSSDNFKPKVIKGKFKNKVQHTKDIFEFFFEFEDLEWKPGQFGRFKFDSEDLEGGNLRVFSFSTIYEENLIGVAVRITETPSAFKAKLASLEIGDEISIHGPMGKFCIDTYDKPLALIAGGIGIPPIRTFLKNIDIKNINANLIDVFYVEDFSQFAYKDEMETLSEKHDFLNVSFFGDRQDFYNDLTEFANKHKNNATYFICGTPGMVTYVNEFLANQGIDTLNIKNDSFTGY